jgi:hypothetical protein
MREHRMIRLVLFPAICALVGCASIRRPPALMFERSALAVQVTTTARDVNAIQLLGGVADITIDGTSDSAISAEVALRSRDSVRLRRECVESSRIDTTRVHGVFRITLRQLSRRRCGETWRLRIPSWLSADVRVSNGAITLNHVEGGVRAEALSTGKITGTVSGDVDVSVGVGDIDLESRQGSYEVVDLTAEVGKVGLTLAGYRIRSDRRPGAGDHIRVSGPGHGTVRARSRVGDVRVRVGSDR